MSAIKLLKLITLVPTFRMGTRKIINYLLRNWQAG